MERAPALAFLDKLHATLFRKEGTFVGSDFYGDIYQAVSWFHEEYNKEEPLIPVAIWGWNTYLVAIEKVSLTRTQIARAFKPILNKHKPLVTQMVKNPLAVWETWVRSLGREDPLEKGLATHSSFLAWRIPIERGAWWAIVHRLTKSWTRLSDLQFFKANFTNKRVK